VVDLGIELVLVVGEKIVGEDAWLVRNWNLAA